MTEKETPDRKEKKDVPKKVEKPKAEPFKMESVTTKPKRAYRKGSKYDAIIESFLKQPSNIVKVEIKEKTANYITTQLNKRITALKLIDKIDASVVNNVAYLEKISKIPLI